MISEILKKHVYDLLVKYMIAVNERDQDELKKQFSVSSEVFGEMMDNLEEFFGSSFSIGIAPFDVALQPHKGGRSNIDIYEMDNPESWGIECVIWENKSPKEPILHAEVSGSENDLQLTYKYIGS